MEYIGYFADFSKYVSIPLLLAFLIYILYFHRGVIKRQFLRTPDFEVDALHVGQQSGISIDFSQRMLAYSDGCRFQLFSASDIHDSGHRWIDVFDEHGNRREKNHEVWILTNCNDYPELSVGFWRRSNAQRCMISLRKLEQTQNDFDREHTPSDIALTTLLEKAGYSHSDAKKSIRNQRIKKAIELLHRKNEQRPEANQWPSTTLIAALKPLFGRRENEPDDIGYTEGTLGRMVSETLKEIRESDKNKLKSKGKK
ncbi:hypothetical protein [Shumkonia mesophila]|uniref:hypothetical protein n=1 Tax=Shumkonia mesophila TaxID=2838854 RepID=UPI0029353327|nr:hypothetical protein [Shumkonia mesophila]